VKKRLEHYLKAELSSEQRAALLEYGKTLSGISSDTAYCSELRCEGACE